MPALAYGAIRGGRNLWLTVLLLATPVCADPVVIAALGDSLTQGYGLQQGDGFVPQMQAWLRAHGAEAEIRNAGVSGDTTRGGLSRVAWTLTPDVQAMIVNLGGNDMLRGLDPAQVRANLDGILTAGETAGVALMLIGMRAPGNYGPDYKQAFDALYPALAEQHNALFIDNYFQPLGDASGTGVDPDLMQSDGIHPNAKGVERIVEAMGPRVLDLIARVERP